MEKIILEKIDVTGQVIEKIELTGRWNINTKDGNYIMNHQRVEEIKIDLEKIQTNFLDNFQI